MANANPRIFSDMAWKPEREFKTGNGSPKKLSAAASFPARMSIIAHLAPWFDAKIQPNPPFFPCEAPHSIAILPVKSNSQAPSAARQKVFSWIRLYGSLPKIAGNRVSGNIRRFECRAA